MKTKDDKLYQKDVRTQQRQNKAARIKDMTTTTIEDFLLLLKNTNKRKITASSTFDNIERNSLQDLSLIPVMFDNFRKFQTNDNISTIDRAKFVFIIALAYSPLSLCGKNLKKDVRKCLAHCFGLKAETTISNNLKDAISYYKIYKDFRADVDKLWNTVMTKYFPDNFLQKLSQEND